MPDAPQRIWLQRDDDDSRHPCESEGVTWCEDKINEGDTGYVRIDLVRAAMPDNWRDDPATLALGLALGMDEETA